MSSSLRKNRGKGVQNMHGTRQHSFTIPSNAWDSIFKKGFVEFPIDPGFLPSVVTPIRDGLLRMTRNRDDAEAFKEVIVGRDEMGWKQDSGLVSRDDDEHKWFFHYCGGITYRHLQESGAPVGDYIDFFRALTKVNALAKLLAVQFAKAYDEISTCPGGPLLPRVQNAFCLSRALLYSKCQERDAPDASVHYDRGFITPHWISTEAGLFLFDKNGNKYTASELSHERITVFPSKKFAAVTRGKHGFGTRHGVKNPLRHLCADERFALVSFVHIELSYADVMWLKDVQAEMESSERACVL